MLEKIRMLSRRYGQITLDWFDDDSGAIYYYKENYSTHKIDKIELFDFMGVEEFEEKLTKFSEK